MTWESIEASNPPPEGIGHTCFCIGSKILFYGGRNVFQRKFSRDLYMYDILHKKWDVVLNTHSVSDRTGHCAIPCSSGMILLMTILFYFTLLIFSPLVLNLFYLVNLFIYFCPKGVIIYGGLTSAGVVSDIILFNLFGSIISHSESKDILIKEVNYL